MYADLHLHSIYSDGTDTPEALFRLAVLNGLSTIAISDHDSTVGVSEAVSSAFSQKYGVRLIPAVELSTILHKRYLHILGYYLDINHNGLVSLITNLSYDKTENTRVNFENAKLQCQFSYRWERVLELNKNQPRLSGVHVVKAMEQDSFSPGMPLWEFFRRYFWAESANFIETETTTAYDVIDAIKKAGGIPVIAHPKSIENDQMVLNLIAYGAEGLEVYHPIHLREDIERYTSMAAEYKLYITGGSDWHGKNNDPGITHIGMTGLDHGDYAILRATENR